MLGTPRIVSTIGDQLVPLVDLKTFLRVNGNALDVEIANYLSSSAGEIEKATGFRLGRQTVEVVGDTWADFEHLLVGPVRAVSQVRYQTADGIWQTLDLTEVELFGGELEQGVRAAAGRTLPRHRSATAVIIMQLDVGRAVIETPLVWALLLLCRGKMDDAEVAVDHLLLPFRINP